MDASIGDKRTSPPPTASPADRNQRQSRLAALFRDAESACKDLVAGAEERPAEHRFTASEQNRAHQPGNHECA